MSTRDEFAKPIIETLAKRAAFICSNPQCRVMCVGASFAAEDKFLYIGTAAHIHAAAPRGPRYDARQSPAERSGIANAIFLCASCADMIDKAGGADFTADLLRAWKAEHEKWVAGNLNKRATPELTILDGEHTAEGEGEVIGLDVQGPVLFKPGTQSRASGKGVVIATRIGHRPREE